MGALLLLLLIYFPAKPPTPPSVTAATGRIDYRQGLLDLIRCWLCASNKEACVEEEP